MEAGLHQTVLDRSKVEAVALVAQADPLATAVTVIATETVATLVGVAAPS